MRFLIVLLISFKAMAGVESVDIKDSESPDKAKTALILRCDNGVKKVILIEKADLELRPKELFKKYNIDIKKVCG